MSTHELTLRRLEHRDPAPCLLCGVTVTWDGPAGPPPQVGDWHLEGDYGCEGSPLNDEEGTDGHYTREDFGAILRDQDEAAQP